MYKIPAKTLFMGHSLVFMPECHSTNDEASRLLESNKDVLEGTVLITNTQTSGRGQRGSTWTSEPGKNLTFTLILKPSLLTVKDQFQLNKVFSLGLVDYLGHAVGGEVKIKWPNDIMANGKKICGILIENHLQGAAIQHSVVGIGLNVNQKDFSIPTATSVSLQHGNDFSLEDVLHDLLFFFEVRYLQLRAGNLEVLNNLYLEALYWKGEKHTFKKPGEIFEGVITGVDVLGRLKINVDGTTEYFDLKQIQFLE